MASRHVVVNGAAGFIGNHLVRALAKDAMVTALARTPPDGLEMAGVNWRQQDIVSGAWPDDIARGADAFVYLAQSRHHRAPETHFDDIAAVNVTGVLDALRWCRSNGVRQFVLMSSGSVYDAGEKPLTEDAGFVPVLGLGGYKASKQASELMAMACDCSIPVTILRPFAVYGPGQRDDMLVARLITSVRQVRPVRHQAGGGIRLSLTHVSDLVDLTVSAIERRATGVFNVAGPDAHSIREIAIAIAEAVGTMPLLEETQEKSPGNLVADMSKTTRELGFPQISFREGVRSCLSVDMAEQDRRF